MKYTDMHIEYITCGRGIPSGVGERLSFFKGGEEPLEPHNLTEPSMDEVTNILLEGIAAK